MILFYKNNKTKAGEDIFQGELGTFGRLLAIGRIKNKFQMILRLF